MRDNLPNASGSRGLPLRILVLEDEYFLAADIERALRARGVEVIGPFGSSVEVENLIRSGAGHLDAAVIDIRSSEGDTYGVADLLNGLCIPFVFATGLSADVIPRRFSAVPRWEKPYEMDELADSVIKLCSSPVPPPPTMRPMLHRTRRPAS
jgi:DNA-binding LytR/AlgR family response regulator